MSVKEKYELSDVMEEGGGGVYLDVVVNPGASNREMKGVDPWRGELKVSVEERPEGGKANKAVVELFSQILGAKDIRLVKGRKAKRKRIFVPDVEAAELEAKLMKGLEEAP